MDYRLGFESLDESDEVKEESVDLHGTLPDWLTGVLLRNGPGMYENDGASVNHWFDGMAMLHRFGFDGAEDEVRYTSRFLRTDAYEGMREGELRRNEFATDPCAGVFGRFFSYFAAPEPTDNAGVNVVKDDETFRAVTETTMPVEFDPETLETLDVPDELDDLGQITTPHPHTDPETGERVSYVTRFGRRTGYRVYVKNGDGREVIAEIGRDEPAYMHSFALTRLYVVLVEFPFVVSPLKIRFGNDTVAESYDWKPDRGTRFTFVDRSTGEVVASPETSPFFAFHHVNAYDDGDDVVLDLAAYDDASVVNDLYLGSVRDDPPLRMPTAELRRYRVNVDTGTVEDGTVYGGSFELPRVRNDRDGREYRYAYGVGHRNVPTRGFPNRLVKVDTREREVSVWEEDSTYPSEPVFVPDPDGTDEDDGVVVSVVLDPNEETSFLLVLDASTFEETARGRVERPVPHGFHGNFYRRRV
ncbi:carotenoid oxygenase family protein [Haladaptatus sp. F3-133]|uniref:Carotenoid oxygenase family protein n=1 Tax=Halorutilus salinus TaxID=2487751 RepID=A0A9Q4C2K2_9EURY|nr:carotenoid oxygenase family protein [Halorutilus salinus]MCX2818298.1 carotenoid oxygenase family protein [Halorutilus salinus]